MTISEHPQVDEYVTFIHELADAARTLLSERHEGSRFETKADASPVTEFDRGVETVLRELVAERFPEHGFIGEEFAPDRADAEFVWIADPIDGTKQFVSGIPVFTTLIALCRNGRPVIGVIDASVSKDRWLGVEGRQSTLNGNPISTSGRVAVPGATMSWSQPDRVRAEHAAGVGELGDAVAWQVFGAGSYGFGRLAAGAIDIAGYSGSFGAYDVCALVPIIEGAGGVITDGYGEPITIADPAACVAAATPELHREVLRYFAGDRG